MYLSIKKINNKQMPNRSKRKNKDKSIFTNDLNLIKSYAD